MKNEVAQAPGYFENSAARNCRDRGVGSSVDGGDCHAAQAARRGAVHRCEKINMKHFIEQECYSCGEYQQCEYIRQGDGDNFRVFPYRIHVRRSDKNVRDEHLRGRWI